MSGNANLFVRGSSTVPVRRKNSQHFYGHLSEPIAHYDSDETELLPLTKKAGQLRVDLAEARKITITSSAKTGTVFNPTELPVIRFRGALSVEEVVEDELEFAEIKLSERSKDSASSKTTQSSGATAVETEAEESEVRHLEISVKSGAGKSRTKKKLNPKKRTKASGFFSTKAEVISLSPHSNQVSPVASLAYSAQVYSRLPTPIINTRTVLLVGSFSLVTSLLLVVVLASLESQTVVSEGSYSTSYGLSLSSLLSVLKERMAALLVHSFGL